MIVPPSGAAITVASGGGVNSSELWVPCFITDKRELRVTRAKPDVARARKVVIELAKLDK